jgi:actin-related protein
MCSIRHSSQDMLMPTSVKTCSGFGGNLRPAFVFPTAVSTRHGHHECDELPNFKVGPGPEHRTRLYDVAHPIRRGVIADWVAYEQLMFSCFCECALPY